MLNNARKRYLLNSAVFRIMRGLDPEVWIDNSTAQTGFNSAASRKSESVSSSDLRAELSPEAPTPSHTALQAQTPAM
jgi:hypothetical protein